MKFRDKDDSIKVHSFRKFWSRLPVLHMFQQRYVFLWRWRTEKAQLETFAPALNASFCFEWATVDHSVQNDHSV